ncbi:hypothetical protein [Embleya sp. NPDC005971]
MIRTPVSIIRDWWSDPAYRSAVVVGIVASVACGVLQIVLHILGG